MPQISRTTESAATADDRISIPAMELPSIRKIYANMKGALGRIMIQVRGGIGDYICAEPAIRWATKNLKQEIHIAAHKPEFYRHLNFASIYNLSNNDRKMPIWEDYLNFHTLPTQDDLTSEFFSHMYAHVVDFHTLLMWKIQVHPLDKSIQLMCTAEEIKLANELINPKNDIVIHPGQTWKSRTIPKYWWDEVISLIKKAGKRPVIIGATVKDCGTVELDNTDCLDLRDKLSLMESVAVCKKTQVILTNDSSPIHMSASGDAWIGFVSSVKPPYLLWHYRYGQMGWRMQNFSKDWLCNHIDLSPTMSQEQIRFDIADTEKWLCPPQDIVQWGISKL